MRTQLLMMSLAVYATAPAALGHPAGHAHLHSPAGWTSGVMIGVAAGVVAGVALMIRRCAQRRR